MTAWHKDEEEELLKEELEDEHEEQIVIDKLVKKNDDVKVVKQDVDDVKQNDPVKQNERVPSKNTPIKLPSPKEWLDTTKRREWIKNLSSFNQSGLNFSQRHELVRFHRAKGLRRKQHLKKMEQNLPLLNLQQRR